MLEHATIGLRVVDATRLDAPYRDALRPAALVEDERGRARRLPRYFYEVDSWKTAENTRLADGFRLYEFINTDVREAEVLRSFPRYVPCAVAVLATYLSAFRRAVDTYVHVSANGGYRSPAHTVGAPASPHRWGTAVNLYRVGDDVLDDEDTITRYAEIVREVLPTAWVRPYGHGTGFADDHLHVDLGYLYVVPRDAEGEADDRVEEGGGERTEGADAEV